MAEQHTERGFGVYTDFIDTYGARVQVVESSLATENRVWVQVHPGRLVPEMNGSACAHLNLQMAEQVRNALDEWIHEQYPERSEVEHG